MCESKVMRVAPPRVLLCCAAAPAPIAGHLPACGQPFSPVHSPHTPHPPTANPPQASNPHRVQPGVWFPVERGALRDRRALLAMASEGSARFELNRTPWQIASDPVQLGFGIYLD